MFLPLTSRLKWHAFLGILLLATSGCSTVVEGRSQQITVKSSPPGALCLLKQADVVIAKVTTPGSAEVRKNKNDLIIFCSKEGYESTSVNNHSDFAIANLGNAVFSSVPVVGSAIGALGNTVDSLSGANNKYTSEIFVKLARADTPAAFPAPPGTPVAMQLPAESVMGMSMQPPMPGTPVELMPSAPVVPVQVTTAPPATPAAVLPSANPGLAASAALAKVTAQLSAQQQVVQLTYAQEMQEASRRPPFD